MVKAYHSERQVRLIARILLLTLAVLWLVVGVVGAKTLDDFVAGTTVSNSSGSSSSNSSSGSSNSSSGSRSSSSYSNSGSTSRGTNSGSSGSVAGALNQMDPSGEIRSVVDSLPQGDAGVMGDYISGFEPITAENMSYASAFASPLVSIIGTITGILAILVVALVPFTTALDLLYISFPPIRPYLYQGGDPMANGQAGGMMGKAGQVNSQAMHQWVSDDAVRAAMLLGANATENQIERGGMMGGPMGGGMGGMQGGMPGGAPAAGSGKGSVISFYLKKRLGFYIMFAVALTLLLSSIFLDFGINIVQFIMGILHSWGIL